MVNLLYYCIFLFCSLFITFALTEQDENLSSDLINTSYNRRAKIFVIPPYPFGKKSFPRTPCIGTDNKDGICLSHAQCIARNGAPAGSCAQNQGVCCVFIATCGGSVSSRISYFTNVGYPVTFNGGTRCTLTINKQSPFICQLRLDFIDLRLASPNYEGRCLDDTFLFGVPGLPRLCGENSGLHGYVDFETNCNTHTLTVDTSSIVSFERKWNVKVTQIPCNSTARAPRGCLMYFDSTSGTVSSYNFRISAPPSPPNLGIGNTNMLLNLNYGVCVKPALGYCSIIWSQSANNMYTFTVSGNSDDAPSEAIAARNGADCTHNFVVIPNPMQSDITDTLLQPFTDRFCGNAFLDTTSSSKPFILTVVTGPQQESDSELDINNRGFLLDFRQTPCRI